MTYFNHPSARITGTLPLQFVMTGLRPGLSPVPRLLLPTMEKLLYLVVIENRDLETRQRWKPFGK